MNKLKLAKLTALVGVGALVLTGCAANESSETPTATGTETQVALSGTLNGAGASSQQAGQEAWVAAFQTANTGVTVNYDPVGSGAGREQFMQGATAFAGSDSYWKDEELAGEFPTCVAGTLPFEFPIWISPIAVIYNLDGVDSLNLDAATTAGIFAGEITKWNDAAIVAQNPDVTLPDLAITAVHRSDESGTSKNFTDYLAKAAGDIWTVGAIEAWPAEYGGEGAQGTSGVVAAVEAGNGTIGYADASRAGELGIANIKVGDAYVSYSAEAASAVVDASPQVAGREAADLAYDIARDTTAAGVYPIVLVSYLMGCTDYADDAQAELVKAYASFLISAEGQQVAAEAAGIAPISDGVRQKAQAIIDSIQ